MVKKVRLSPQSNIIWWQMNLPNGVQVTLQGDDTRVMNVARHVYSFLDPIKILTKKDL